MTSRPRIILISIATSIILLSCFSPSAISSIVPLAEDIDSFSFKQEIIIPIDTSLPESKYQPIDTRIDFENKCWGKDENIHSIRVGVNEGGAITEIESQVYEIEFLENNIIKSCNLVFLIPENADGTEEYYVFYDSSEKEGPNYEKRITVEDSHYFYEPIPGQIIDIDYYGIKEGEFYRFGVIQKGELLGNPVSQGIIKPKKDIKILETYNMDQLCSMDMTMDLEEEPGYIGTAWATDVKKTVLVDGNLMTRIRLKGMSPAEDMLTDNIYTYYYSPCETKRIFVDVHHEVLKDIVVDQPDIVDGTYGSIISIKSRSSTIEKMNAGYIYPDIHVYTEEEGIENFPFPPNPSTLELEVIISTEDDIDLGDHAWVSLSDPDRGIAHAMILDSNKGISAEDDGIQVKAWGKQNINLPGLEADTGNLYIVRNDYENNHLNSIGLKKGFKANFKMEFVTFYENGMEQVDKESEIFQTLSKINPELRKNTTDDQKEETERFSLATFIHNAPSTPIGPLLCAASGIKLPYIYAELYENDEFQSSGSANRLAMCTANFDLEGKSVFEILKLILGMFDIKNSSIFKKIVFPDLEPGKYIVKIFRENPLFGEDHKFIGFGIANVYEDTVLRIFCTSEGVSNFKVLNQDEIGVENVEFSLLKDGIVISDGISDVNGSVVLKAPTSIKDPYTLRVLYDGFLVEEKEFHLGLINHFIIRKDQFDVALYDLKVKLVDKWGFKPYTDVNLKLTSSDMVESFAITPVKIDNSEYVFENILGSNYVLTLKHKSFQTEENIKIDKDHIVELEFPEEYTISLNVFNSLGFDIDNGRALLSREGKTISTEIDEEGVVNFIVPPGEYDVDITVDDDPVAFQKVVVSSQKTLDIIAKNDSWIHTVALIIGVLALICIFGYMFLKKKINLGVKLLVVVLLFISVFQPWWVLSGEKNNINTHTTTMLYPPKMITLTESSDALGGSISALPQELVDILVVLSVLLVISILLILINAHLEKRHSKISKIVFVITIVLLIASISIFYFALSLVTEAGVGGFFGSGDVSISIPGQVESIDLSCSWGPGIGFILAVVSVLLLVGFVMYNKRNKVYVE